MSASDIKYTLIVLQTIEIDLPRDFCWGILCKENDNNIRNHASYQNLLVVNLRKRNEKCTSKYAHLIMTIFRYTVITKVEPIYCTHHINIMAIMAIERLSVKL